MFNECYLSKDNYKGSGFLAKKRTGLGDYYKSSSSTRGKGPEEPSVSFRTQT